jgi:hypothetical protein
MTNEERWQAENGCNRAIRRDQKRLKLLRLGYTDDRKEPGVSVEQEMANIKSYIDITIKELERLENLRETA